ncbi:hypothetical protein BS17DRAFT_771974 [Gyrodon lividus]|nr:hypothetical protein BS17DRAFT_771974 [Gyrodon lividus]
MPYMPSEVHISENNTEGTAPASSPSPVITPPKSSSRGPLVDLSGWSSYSVMCTQAPGGGSSGGVHESGTFSSDTHHALGVFQRPSHLPTPQSPGNISSYLLTDSCTPGTSTQILQPSPDSSALPTEFQSYVSPSPLPPFRPHQILTPESSPLVTRSRGNGSHVLSQSTQMCSQDGIPTMPSKRKSSRSREPTSPYLPARQTPTRPVTPSLRTAVPPASLQRTPTRRSSPESDLDNILSNHSHPENFPSPKVKDESGGEIARIRAENHLALAQEAESCRPDYLKRDTGGKERSLSRTSANIGIIDSPIKGRRITLFQETSDESFEESLMAGGYKRYRSDGPSWGLDGDTEAPISVADVIGQEVFGRRVVLSEEDQKKKRRLAAFFDSPRASSSKTQLYPVDIEGCGRVLMSLEPSEPQTPPKPSPSKAKRSRKKKKACADQKKAADQAGAVTLEEPKVDGPNWPDMEFPWRFQSMMQDGYSKVERGERLRFIESFLGRDSDSDSDDVEEGTLSPSWQSVEEATSRSLRRGRGKMYPLLSHSKDRRYGLTTLSVVPSDSADAKTALLSKRSIRAIQLRLLRRQNTDRDAGSSDSSETACICQGRDDGRQLVQCDGCHTWYHLECIGIQNTSDLGREEDPWFCANCVEVRAPPLVAVPLAEPTFVPTDEAGGQHNGSVSFDEGYDPPFFNAGHPLPATPWTRSTRVPTTPPRTHPGPHFSSGSTWDGPPSSSRGGPHTPHFSSASAYGDMVRVYSTTPGRVGDPLSSLALEESPFDPTSTPSRGIRFGAPFTTPKNGLWGQGRATGQDLFHTPTRPWQGGSGSSRHFARDGQYILYPSRGGELQGDGTSGGQLPHTFAAQNDYTPIGRNVIGPTRSLESPLGAKRSRR